MTIPDDSDNSNFDNSTIVITLDDNVLEGIALLIRVIKHELKDNVKLLRMKYSDVELLIDSELTDSVFWGMHVLLGNKNIMFYTGKTEVLFVCSTSNIIDYSKNQSKLFN